MMNYSLKARLVQTEVSKRWLDYEYRKLDIQPCDGHNIRWCPEVVRHTHRSHIAATECLKAPNEYLVLADSCLNSSQLNGCDRLSSHFARSTFSALKKREMILVL